eukprot:Amastigsp_a175072_680.p1 type:complete len:207 gc:universal Amastigsp_a175072_680:242-862(+)
MLDVRDHVEGLRPWRVALVGSAAAGKERLGKVPLDVGRPDGRPRDHKRRRLEDRRRRAAVRGHVRKERGARVPVDVRDLGEREGGHKAAARPHIVQHREDLGPGELGLLLERVRRDGEHDESLRLVARKDGVKLRVDDGGQASESGRVHQEGDVARELRQGDDGPVEHRHVPELEDVAFAVARDIEDLASGKRRDREHERCTNQRH